MLTAGDVPLLMTFAGKNRKPGIFGIAGIAGRELAEHEVRAAIGLKGARMNAIGAQARIRVPFRLWLNFSHGDRIAQTRNEAFNHSSLRSEDRA